ncbi:testis-specific Y-encoded-like protein 1 [Platysternon megacephalum]|uniref:Testis-specific Y-encoded-like protein 1 n=1 Tax=Platysternon megacephalum TaxID=55544 RepID=A0A4D9DMN4_9SAUR|nr:testis-specific Y-encoded-like protein 1 [Platysternon megacephalum]
MAERTLDCGGAPSQAVLTPGEACNPIQLPVATPGRNSLARPHSTDQEMQWLSEVGRSPIQTEPPAQNQFFLEPCEMGKGAPTGSCEGLCKDPPEELCEAMCEDPPREPCEDPPREPCEVACVELCEDTPPWELCRDPPMEPSEGLCKEMCKDPPPRKPCEGPRGSPVQGKARLPSIVVEPTEVGEVESGELRWPPDDFLLLEGEDELFTDEEEQAAGPGPGPPALESTLDEVLL